MTVTISTATVYFGGRRRWFSLDAACRAEAKQRFKKDEDSDGSFEDRVPVLAAEARAEFERTPVKALAAPEARAVAACRELFSAKAEVDRISCVIGESLNACPLMKDPIDFGPKGPITHLTMAYAAEDVENDNWPGTHKEWNSQHLLDDCPHCMAAHRAIQERKIARRRLGIARRAVTMIGRQK